VHLFVIERKDVESDSYDLGTVVDAGFVKCWAKLLEETVYAGGPSTLHMTYREDPVMKKWIPRCR